MKDQISATAIVNDFNRRKITPDFTHDVTQGTLNIWRLNQRFIAELHTGNDGVVIVTGRSSYRNTTSPQDIADDLMTESKLTNTELSQIAGQMGKLGGSAKTEAKSNASRENGKLGGRPKKVKQ